MTCESGRRRFLRRIIAMVHGVIGASVAVVAGSAALSPTFERRIGSWLPAGSLLDLIDDEPTPVTIRVARQDGYREFVDRQVVFLVKTGDNVTALSSTCSHLGCRVRFDAADKLLRCPCHGGAFDLTGAVVSGPPPAGLASLPLRLDGEQVLVQL